MKIIHYGFVGLLAPPAVLSTRYFWSNPVRDDWVQKVTAGRQLQRPPDHPDHEQEQEEAPPGLFRECLVIAESFASDGLDCYCEFNGDGSNQVLLQCTDTCEYCDDAGTTCGFPSFEIDFIGGSGLFSNLTTSFQYTTGRRDDVIAFEQFDCDFLLTGSCEQCEAFVNFRKCTSCEVCDVETGAFAVDCENVEMGSSFDYCLLSEVGRPIQGVFEAVSYDNINCDSSTMVPNARCANATFLSPENPSVIQTLNAFEIQDPVPFCFRDQPSNGVWFRVVGTGNVMSVSTCSQNTFIETLVAVYQDGCNSLQCVSSAQQQQGCFNYFPGNSVSWISEEGRLYHVLVGSRYGDSSQFEINLYDVFEGARTCSESGTSFLEIDERPISGSIDLFSGGDSDINDACSGASGVWYRVESPMDAVLRASTCLGTTNFYTAISVMQGSDCDSLTCVASRGPFEYIQNCGEGGIELEWEATAGTTYYILVYGEYGERGIFSLSVELLNPPENDVCSGALQIFPECDYTESLVDATTAGEIMGAMNETNAIYSCTYSTSPGIWYAVAGSGSPMRVSSCSFEGSVVLSVYGGSCTSLNCINMGSYNTRCSGAGGSTVSWNSVSGETYYVLAQSDYGRDVVFDLSIDEVFPPDNDDCSLAMGPIAPGSDLIFGSTFDAIFDGVFSCFAGSSSGGLWYKVIGNGQAMRADTCYDTSGRFDSEMAVYNGTCGSLQCLASNDDSCGLSSAITWPTVDGVEYFIRVNGLHTGVGDFWLNITTFEPVENDQCQTASEIADGDTLPGTLFGATQELAPFCDRYDYDEGYVVTTTGVWYFVDGQDLAYRASTCSRATSFYSSILVFGGSCEDLVCEATPGHEDYSCRQEYPGSVATWFGASGQRYYILVSDFGGSGGNFELSLTSFEPVGNDRCEDAFTIDLIGEESGTLIGATTIGENNVNVSCTYSSGPGVWYQVTGTGTPMKVSSCSFDVGVMLSVYSGSCSSLSCISSGIHTEECRPYLGASVSWNSVEGEVYYVLVTSYGDEGTFDLFVEEVTPPDNDECSAAMGPIEPGSGVIEGSTVDAIFDGVFSCYFGSTSPALWYSVVGTGEVMRADTCSQITNFDSELAVYNGACNELQCLASNDDSCGLSSAVTWQSVEGVVYYIRVNGLGSNVGDFGLSIRSLRPATNGDCATRLGLAPGETIVQTLDSGFQEDRVPFCFRDQSFNGVWFEVIGTGNTLSVSTCSQNTFIETSISVFQGTCDNLNCAGGVQQHFNCLNFSPGSSVSWESEPGAIYFVLIGSRYRGFEDDYGEGVGFGAQVEVTLLEIPQASGFCTDAEESSLSIDGQAVAGSVSRDNVFQQSEDECNVAYNPGAWYRLDATEDAVLRASTCSGVTNFYTGISVMEGADCESLRCVNSVGPYQYIPNCGDGGNQVEWAAVAGTSYFIMVHGDYEERGIFGLSVRALDPPANDVCQGAFPLGLDDDEIGSLVDSTMVGENVTNSCSYSPSPGVWYEVTGTGSPMRVSACFFEIGVTLSIYNGSCTNLTCINTGSSSYSSECRGYDGSSVIWNSVEGEAYYLLVQSAYGPEEGTFQLSLAEIIPPDNDDCLGALNFELGSEPVFGSTVDAIFDGEYSCMIGSPSGSLWYSIIGTGQAMRADTCFRATGFDTEIAVFNGTCGSGLQCIGTNDDSCGLSSSIAWLSVPEVEYFIRVKGLGVQVGDFWLDITAFDPAENDFCEMGLPLRPGSSIEGSLDGATQDTTPYCDGYYYNGPGVWYYVDGNSTTLRASACSFDSSFNVAVQVFSGSCANLTCVSSSPTSDYSCGENYGYQGSSAAWFAAAGQRYYVLVTDYVGSGGDFTLSLSTFEAAENDFCLGAVMLEVDGLPVRGSTRNATGDSLASCRYSEAAGVWYSLVGNGRVVNVTTCSGELNFDAVMTVSSGPCDGFQECVFYAAYNEPNCFASFYAASTATWRAEEGVTYHILVQGSSPEQVGEFVLSVNSFEAVNNDECSRASPIPANGTLVIGSTLGSTYDPSLTYCSGFQSPDVWYSIAGTGRQLTASTCTDYTTYDSALSVYSSFGRRCTDLTCVATNDDACGSATSEVSWFADTGVTYFLRVHGYASNAGNFGLLVTGGGGDGGGGPDPVVDGDSCSTSIFIPVADGSLIRGSTIGASFSGISDCSGFPSPDVWYYVQGTGSPMTASLCDEQFTNFDTYLSVYLSPDGGCDSMRCFISNDDSICGLPSEISWATEPGSFYYLRVHGFGNGVGGYGLRVFSEGGDSGGGDPCSEAIPIPVADGSLIRGSTAGESYGGRNDCSGFEGPDVWYSYEGTGEEITASMCHEETDYDSYLSVYVSASGGCQSMSCLTSNDDNCGSLTSEVTWFAENRMTYYLRVHGFGGSSGSFGLSLFGFGSGTDNNDNCEGALSLDPAITNFITADTSMATYSGAPACSGASSSSSPDLWYTIEGTGATMLATTCYENTFFDTQISVYQGNCFSLRCVGGNDDSCASTRSTVEWFAERRTTYFIRVDGFGSSAGQFELSVGLLGRGNDQCQNAIPAFPFSTFAGTTIGATSDPLLARCGDATAVVSNGVWYSIVGDGTPLVASTCEGTNYDTQISVFLGFNCDSLECVDGNDQHCGDQSLVEWNTVPGAVYYILVHGYLSSSGDFTLNIYYSSEDERSYAPSSEGQYGDDDKV